MDDKAVQHFVEYKLKSFPKVEQIRSMHSIVVTPNLLADLEKVIKKSIPNDSCQIRYTCKYKKKADAHFNSIQELDGCDNSLDRTINYLVMEVSAGKDFSAEITFGKATLEDLNCACCNLHLPTPVNVYGYVKGKEKQVAQLKANIDYQLQRYSHKAIHSFLSNAGVLCILILSTGLFWGYYHFFGVPTTYSIPLLGIAHRPFSTTTFWGRIWPTFQLFLYAFLSALCLRGTIQRLFPRVRFVMGDNQEDMQHRRMIKEHIFLEVTINIIVQLLISLFQWYHFE